MKSLDKTLLYVEPDVAKGGLKTGIKVEDEHFHGKKKKVLTPKEVAQDHLKEDPDYYDDWDNKEKILFQDKAPKVKKSDRLRRLYERRIDTSLPDAPSFEEWRDGLSKSDKKEVAAVGVIHDGKMLMMQRRDNLKWTNPGGHLEEGEKPAEGAKRELKEEANIDADSLKKIAMKNVVTPEGKKLKIHAFIYEPKDKPKFSAKNDPDKEAIKHKWVNMEGFDQEILENLHSPKNVILQKLGILKSLFSMGLDLIKGSGGGHKYIRKYKRGNKWIYIYKEPSGHSRQLPEEAIKRLKELADLGDERAQKMYENIVEYSPEKLRLLRELHALGDQQAKGHLHEMGIDPDIEQVAESIRPQDPIRANLSSEEKTKVFNAIDGALKEKIFDYLNSHRTTPFGSALERTVGSDWAVARRRIMDAINKKGTIEDMLQEFHRQLNVIDAAMPNISTTRNSSAQNAGSYGNLAYNSAIQDMVRRNVLPEGYDQAHTRTVGSATHEVPPTNEIRERAERARAEREAAAARAREEAERRTREEAERVRRANAELFAKHGESVKKMSSYFNKTIGAEDQVRLMKGIDKVFGGDFKFDSFVNKLQGHPDVEIKVSESFYSGLLTGSRDFGVSFNFVERSTGRNITRATRTIEKGSDGEIIWHNGCFGRSSNADLERYPGMAKGLYQGVESFLREVTANYPQEAKNQTRVVIGTAANSGFGDGYKGALVWAKHCFDFSSASTASTWKGTWNTQLSQYARRGMKQEDVTWLQQKIDRCQYPEDFVRLGMKVTRDQALRLLGRSDFDNDFNKLFREKGHVDLGELIIIDTGTSWSGSKNYVNATTGRAGELNARRKVFYRQTEATARPETRNLQDATPETRSTVTMRPQQSSSSTGATSPPNPDVDRIRRRIDSWRPRGTRNTRIAITEARLRRMNAWPIDDVRGFLRTAPLSPAARQRVRELLARRERE